MILALLLAAMPAAATPLGGHAPPEAVVAPEGPAEDRKALLEELWQRRVLEPEQRSWSPSDTALLERIRRDESEALAYLRTKPGGVRPWVFLKRAGGISHTRLTSQGHRRWVALVSQDALLYFENKGADAKVAFRLTDMEGRRLFSPEGQITEEGLDVYRRAKAKLEVYWKSPDGQVWGTRRPPSRMP